MSSFTVAGNTIATLFSVTLYQPLTEDKCSYVSPCEIYSVTQSNLD